MRNPFRPYSIWRFLSDLLLVCTSAQTLHLLAYADVYDKATAIGLTVIAWLVRFVVLRAPLLRWSLATYLLIWYEVISNFDKLQGYGLGQRFEFEQVFCFLAIIVISLSITRTYLSPVIVIGLVFVVTPLTLVPSDIARNVYARKVPALPQNVFVTRITEDDIYGVSFDTRKNVFHMRGLRTHPPLITWNDVRGLGEGSMPAQGWSGDLWRQSIVRWIVQGRNGTA